MSTESELSPSSDDPPERRRTAAVCDIFLENPSRLKEADTRRHRPWIEALVAELAPAAESFAIRFVGDREMRRFNAEFRGQEKTTDVLSFPDSTASHEEHPPERRRGHLGDVVVSTPQANRQATEHGHPVEKELRILMLHGLLHCLGFDHETDDGTMERLEARLRERWIDHE